MTLAATIGAFEAIVQAMKEHKRLTDMRYSGVYSEQEMTNCVQRYYAALASADEIISQLNAAKDARERRVATIDNISEVRFERRS
jgi:hypothetical protein